MILTAQATVLLALTDTIKIKAMSVNIAAMEFYNPKNFVKRKGTPIAFNANPVSTRIQSFKENAPSVETALSKKMSNVKMGTQDQKMAALQAASLKDSLIALLDKTGFQYVLTNIVEMQL